MIMLLLLLLLLLFGINCLFLYLLSTSTYTDAKTTKLTLTFKLYFCAMNDLNHLWLVSKNKNWINKRFWWNEHFNFFPEKWGKLNALLVKTTSAKVKMFSVVSSLLLYNRTTNIESNLLLIKIIIFFKGWNSFLPVIKTAENNLNPNYKQSKSFKKQKNKTIVMKWNELHSMYFNSHKPDAHISFV